MAITKARMQVKRGNESDFDPSQMLPGEWAVSLDTKYVRMCFAPGICVRMATYDAFEADMEGIRDILLEAQTIQEAVARIQTEINDTAVVVEDYSVLSKSYAVGGTGKRENEDSDNAKYYYEQTKQISQGINGIVPMGTVAFADLPTANIVNNAMYNVSDAFTSDARFNDGGGIYYGPGNNVIWTSEGKWDVTASSSVTGIKGSAESAYRVGNVNITPSNIGLGNVNNTSDADKPISTATQEAIDALNGSLKNLTQLSGVSLLSVQEQGRYYIANPTDPLEGENGGYLEVSSTSLNYNYRTIEWTPNTKSYKYINTCANGTWSGWEKVALHSSLTPQLLATVTEFAQDTISGTVYLYGCGKQRILSGTITISSNINSGFLIPASLVVQQGGSLIYATAPLMSGVEVGGGVQIRPDAGIRIHANTGMYSFSLVYYAD